MDEMKEQWPLCTCKECRPELWGVEPQTFAEERAETIAKASVAEAYEYGKSFPVSLSATMDWYEAESYMTSSVVVDDTATLTLEKLQAAVAQLEEHAMDSVFAVDRFNEAADKFRKIPGVASPPVIGDDELRPIRF